MTAKIPTGRSIEVRDVPIAFEEENFKKKINIGTMIIPPPIPNNPEAIPAVPPISRAVKITIKSGTLTPQSLKTLKLVAGEGFTLQAASIFNPAIEFSSKARFHSFFHA